MSYLETVCTNVHAGPGRPRDLVLAPKVVVVGPTGSGKTRIVTSIALLLTGAADDVLGRHKPVATEGDLVCLAPPGEGLCVEGSWDDKKSAQLVVKWDAATGKTKRKSWAGLDADPDWLHPVRTVAAWLRKSPEEARKCFAPFIVGHLDDDTIGAMLPAQYVDPERGGGDTPTTMDQLVARVTLAKTRVKEEKDKIKHNDSLVNQLSTTLEPVPGTAQVQNATAATEVARQHLERARAAQQMAQQSAGLSTQLEQATATEARAQTTLTQRVAEREEADKLLAAAKAQVPPEPQLPISSEILDYLEAGVLLLAGAEAQGLDKCPVCLAQVGQGTLVQRLEFIRGQLSGFAQQNIVADAAVDHRANYLAQLELCRRQTADVRQRAEVAQKLLISAQVHLNSLQAVNSPELSSVTGGVDTSTPVETASLNDLEAAYHAATQVQAHLQHLTGQWQTVKQARTTIVEAGEIRGWWEGYYRELLTVHDRLIDEGLAVFTSKIQRWMPEGLDIDLTLRASNRDVFRLGLISDELDGALVLSPSGGQRAAILLALAAACLELLGDKAPTHAVLMLDEERGVDPNFLGTLMRALTDCPWQVVLTSLHKPKRAPRSGWTVLELEKLAAAGAEADAAEAAK